MNPTARRTTAIAGTMVAATTLVSLAPAQAATVAPSKVTVQSTDYTPAVGQTFRLYGAVWSQGVRVPATIRVKTFNQGRWVLLRGAVMHTTLDNRYRIRIILRLKGPQMLRVIGDPDTTSIATARKTITVTVH